jgi:uncharacterized membrane protein HdeD (DUF308 family)
MVNSSLRNRWEGESMKQSTWWMIGGILLLVGGVLALLDPFAATLSATWLAAWFFLVGGAVQIIAAFSAPAAGNKVWILLIGIVSAYLGISLFKNPLAGMLSLTLAAGSLIAVSAVVRLVMALDFKGTHAFWSLLLSALVSGVLAFLIFSEFPGSATVFLGIYLGVELVFGGVGLLGLASAARKVEKLVPGA